MQKRITKKKVARKLDVKDLRRSDRTRTLRYKNIKGPRSDSSQHMVIDDDDNEDPQMVQEDVGPSSQPNSIDPKVGGCLGTLRNWSQIERRLTQ
jgi:hypothetical protein